MCSYYNVGTPLIKGFPLHTAPGWEQVAGWRELGGIKHEEEIIKEVFEVVHCLNLLAALGWQSLNWSDEEMHRWMDGWMDGCREEETGGRREEVLVVH